MKYFRSSSQCVLQWVLVESTFFLVVFAPRFIAEVTVDSLSFLPHFLSFQWLTVLNFENHGIASCWQL